MSTIQPEKTLKDFPEVFGTKVTKETEETVTIKGIQFKIKRFTTLEQAHGIRVSLEENTHPLFIKFNEHLLELDSQRPDEEKAAELYSFTTLIESDPGLEIFEGAGFYVYRRHLVFTEEENSESPMERLIKFIDYYKRKFNLKTSIREDLFSELDELELT